MSNVIGLNKCKTYHGIARRVAFGKMPIEVVEELVHAAIAVGWAAGEGEYSSDTKDAEDRMIDLVNAVNKATEHSIPVDYQTGLPV